ncbi:MAG: hypothetical protein WD534_09080 [Phycisphaeraceae bacterium]
MEEAIVDPERDVTDVMEFFTGDETPVKEPGGGEWMARIDGRAREIMRVECPDGSRARAVLPRD